MADQELQQLIQDLQRLNQVAAQAGVSLRGVNGQSTFFTGSGVSSGVSLGKFGGGPSTFFTPSLTPPGQAPVPVPSPVIKPNSILPKGVSATSLLGTGRNLFNVGESLAYGDIGGAVQQSVPLLRSPTLAKLVPSIARSIPYLAVGAAAYEGAVAGSEVKGSGFAGLKEFGSKIQPAVVNGALIAGGAYQGLVSAGLITGGAAGASALSGGALFGTGGLSFLGGTALGAAAVAGSIAFAAGSIAFAVNQIANYTKPFEEQAQARSKALKVLNMTAGRSLSRTEVDDFIAVMKQRANREGNTYSDQLTQEMEKLQVDAAARKKEIDDIVNGNLGKEKVTDLPSFWKDVSRRMKDLSSRYTEKQLQNNPEFQRLAKFTADAISLRPHSAGAPIDGSEIIDKYIDYITDLNNSPLHKWEMFQSAKVNNERFIARTTPRKDTRPFD